MWTGSDALGPGLILLGALVRGLYAIACFVFTLVRSKEDNKATADTLYASRYFVEGLGFVAFGAGFAHMVTGAKAWAHDDDVRYLTWLTVAAAWATSNVVDRFRELGSNQVYLVPGDGTTPSLHVKTATTAKGLSLLVMLAAQFWGYWCLAKIGIRGRSGTDIYLIWVGAGLEFGGLHLYYSLYGKKDLLAAVSSFLYACGVVLYAVGVLYTESTDPAGHF